MKINWVGEVPGITREKTAFNIGRCKDLGLPGLSKRERPALAVVGGGPSAADYAAEIRDFPGDVWASGSAFQWVLSVRRTGIMVTPTFFTIDQSPELAIDGRGATKAILATCCDPAVFDMLAAARIEVFDLVEGGPNANHWATTVTAAPKISLDMGYRDITFYGCDSSFMGDEESFSRGTHAYTTAPVKDALIVRCGGKDFITRPSFVMQAEFMAGIIRIAPGVFKLRGGGLLAAMVETHEYDTTHAVQEVADRILRRAA